MATKTDRLRTVRLSFSFPTSLEVRDRIRELQKTGGERLPMDERGDWTHYMKGQKLRISEIPTDVRKGLGDVFEPLKGKASDG